MKNLFLFLILHCSALVYCQDINVLMKQASNYERALKEDSAILKYASVIAADSTNLAATIKLSLLTSAAAARQTNKVVARQMFDKALNYAEKSFMIDSSGSDVLFAKALAIFKRSNLETENKNMVEDLKEAYTLLNKSLQINKGHAKSNFLMGLWNFELVQTAWTKKTAFKILYGGLPNATIEKAIAHFEQCKTTEPYFVQNYLELARAYQFNNNPSKTLEILNLLVKLPNRTADDMQFKADGKKMLSELQ